MRWALLSLHDKSGIEEFARKLTELGFGLLASGGTAATLRRAGLEVREVSDYTGAPEVLSGRVKTLHPAVHAGILARSEDLGSGDLERVGAEPIAVVAVSLYPFQEALSRGATEPELIEEIDIGGVTLLRAAAKNMERVFVVPGPAYYGRALAAIEAGDETERHALAAEAFMLTARYDMQIANHFASGDWPPFPIAAAGLAEPLRYGENPHQSAAVLRDGSMGVASGEILQGKELSYNNLLDAEAAWRLALDLPSGAAAVIKHQTPSGVAVLGALGESLLAAVAADDEAAFGGVVALRGEIDAGVAEYLTSRFFEVVIAEGASGNAREILRRKPNLRVLLVQPAAGPKFEIRAIGGGYALQTPDTEAGAEPWRLAGGPDRADLMDDLRFAWTVVHHARSNAIVLVRDGVTLGIGAGQVSRVRAARQAIAEATAENCRGAVLASDAFFPFGDVLELAADAGIVAVVEPGGSMRDQDSIDVATRREVALYFTGRRHFRH